MRKSNETLCTGILAAFLAFPIAEAAVTSSPSAWQAFSSRAVDTVSLVTTVDTVDSSEFLFYGPYSLSGVDLKSADLVSYFRLFWAQNLIGVTDTFEVSYAFAPTTSTSYLYDPTYGLTWTVYDTVDNAGSDFTPVSGKGQSAPYVWFMFRAALVGADTSILKGPVKLVIER